VSKKTRTHEEQLKQLLQKREWHYFTNAPFQEGLGVKAKKQRIHALRNIAMYPIAFIKLLT